MKIFYIFFDHFVAGVLHSLNMATNIQSSLKLFPYGSKVLKYIAWLYNMCLIESVAFAYTIIVFFFLISAFRFTYLILTHSYFVGNLILFLIHIRCKKVRDN